MRCGSAKAVRTRAMPKAVGKGTKAVLMGGRLEERGRKARRKEDGKVVEKDKLGAAKEKILAPDPQMLGTFCVPKLPGRVEAELDEDVGEGGSEYQW